MGGGGGGTYLPHHPIATLLVIVVKGIRQHKIHGHAEITHMYIIYFISFLINMGIKLSLSKDLV